MTRVVTVEHGGYPRTIVVQAPVDGFGAAVARLGGCVLSVRHPAGVAR